MLLARACAPQDLRTLVFAGVLDQARRAGSRQLIRGLSEERFQRLIACFFPGVALRNGAPEPEQGVIDEYDDVLELLMRHRAQPDEESAWLCHAMASAAMRENHLWQDMGLPNRKALSELIRQELPALHAKNTGDMRWKKFFYRQICEQAEILICKAPHCAVCTDYAACFGSADVTPVRWEK